MAAFHHLLVAFLALLTATVSSVPNQLTEARRGDASKHPGMLETIVRSRRKSVSANLRRSRKRRSSGNDENQAEETPTPLDDAVESATEAIADRLSCFPPHATVELFTGSRLRMDGLSVGDVVRVAPGNGREAFSPVFMFTHKDANAVASLVTLETATGAAITSTDGHYIYADGELVRARDVRVGASLTLASGQKDSVVKRIFSAGAGVYNPQTISGDIVVNDVIASTYTTAVAPTVAHALLAPMRMLNSLGFTVAALESGGGIFAEVAPQGPSVVA